MMVLIVAAVACLAFANGGNDNFKGVATLFGSGTSNYRRALTWATVTTLLGSLAAFILNLDAVAQLLFSINDPFLYVSVWSFCTTAAVAAAVSVFTRPAGAAALDRLMFVKRRR